MTRIRVSMALPSSHVSSPLITPSPQRTAAHMPSSQTRLSQSSGRLQLEPVPHGVQPPPQSTEVSSPLRTPSMQLAEPHTPSIQKSDKQSLDCRQRCPRSQRRTDRRSQYRTLPDSGRHHCMTAPRIDHLYIHRLGSQTLSRAEPVPQPNKLPPQSVLVSEPLRTPSVQLASVHRLLSQIVDRQSRDSRHRSRLHNQPQLGPPQSTSVSRPVGCRHDRMVLRRRSARQ